jgi:hypothetical protein
MKLTKQGVRDLDPPNKKRNDKVIIPKNCSHKRMRYCCYPKKCGHLVCPDCGLAYDEMADNPCFDVDIDMKG